MKLSMNNVHHVTCTVPLVKTLNPTVSLVLLLPTELLHQPVTVNTDTSPLKELPSVKFVNPHVPLVLTLPPTVSLVKVT
jgi:hypothetical protein